MLVELSSPPDGRPSSALRKDTGKDSLRFLRSLSADIQGARFQKSVMPFALLVCDSLPDSKTTVDADRTLDAAASATYLHAGAIDIVRSPLQHHHEDLNRMIGHVQEMSRPPAKLIGAPMAQSLVDSIRDNSEPATANHRPDQRLTALRRQAVEHAIREWHFPAHDFNADELTYGAMCMLEHILRNPELEPYGLSRPKLMTFLLATRRQYKHEREVHYHNWRHAVDVTQSLYHFLLSIRICPPIGTDEQTSMELNAVERILTPLDGLIMLVSAIGHDVGHPGVNNAFLVACNHPLAQTYNDKSVLENYHCAAYSQLLRRHWSSLHNITGFRATMISTILATDMQRHFEYMSSVRDLKSKIEKSEVCVEDWSDKERENTRELIMALLMKAADISNVARPFEISAKWASILMDEFARQGELESELQIPTCLFGGPPNKEDVLAAAQSQKGFMSLFGFPLFQGISEIMPSVYCAIRELENNRTIWDQKIEEEMNKRQPLPGDATPLTLSPLTDEDFKKAKARHQSEPHAVPTEPAQLPSTPTKRAAVTGVDTSPSKHAVHDLRQQLVRGIPAEDGKRASAPFLASPGMPMSPTGGSSRRSSKDVALEQLQQMSASLPQVGGDAGSRRASADPSWQIHSSYPGSRRGSKDESLTTILVTSGGTPNRRASPTSPSKKTRQSIPHSHKQAAVASGRTSAPSSKCIANSVTSATTTQHSPSIQQSTQPSSPEEESIPPGPYPSIPSTEDPFMMPGNWPNDLDGTHRSSVQQGLPQEPQSMSPRLPALGKSESSQVLTRLASGETDDHRRKSERGMRESRSRSRLRGLKFWKKKRDVSGVDAASADSAPNSP